MGQRSIVMLCSLDTKASEAQYLKDCIEKQGAKTVLIDIGYGYPAQMAADISARQVAKAAGSDIDTIRGMKGSSDASTLMTKGAISQIFELLEQKKCDGVIAFGGASNTTLATSIMKTLPFGIPKLMISSAAAMPAYSAMFFGSRDITIMHATVDISGLNDLTRAFLQRGAGAIYGMVACSDGPVEMSKDNKVVAVTSFRFAEGCCQAVMRELERRGYVAIPFHAQGVGENAMENLLAQGLFHGVIDVVPAGLSEQLLGGNRAARPDRLEGAGKAGIPQVIATSGFDMISCGPIERRDADDALWKKRALASRQYVIPDRYRVEARTTIEEVVEIAECVAEKLNKATAPAAVMVPVLGWSSLSVKDTGLYNKEADAAFVPALKGKLKPEISVTEIDAELNSEKFAHALVDALHAMIEAKTNNKAMDIT